jgi:hypothetical protein
MAEVFPGRYTADHHGEVVVFLIGMRVNRPWKVHKWLPVLTAMPKMIKELEALPDSGFIGAQNGLLGSSPFLVQWWRSFEDLDRYARNPDQAHLPAWRSFNRRVRASGDVGIWHETYRVRDGEWETIYGNMPRFGFAKVAGHVPVSARGQSAARRIGASEDDVPALTPYENPTPGRGA